MGKHLGPGRLLFRDDFLMRNVRNNMAANTATLSSMSTPASMILMLKCIKDLDVKWGLLLRINESIFFASLHSVVAPNSVRNKLIIMFIL